MYNYFTHVFGDRLPHQSMNVFFEVTSINEYENT